MGDAWVCYVLSFVTRRGREEREYYGITEVLRGRGQSPDEACQHRMLGPEGHIAKPTSWNKDADTSTMTIRPLGHVMTKANALAQELLNLVHAYSRHPRPARGACYSGPWLSWPNRNTLEHIHANVRHCQTPADARAKLQSLAAELEEDHPVRKHLEDRWDSPELVVTRTENRVRIGHSGVQGSVTRRNQLQRGDYEHGDDTHRRLLHGVDVSTRIREANERRVHRSSGTRKRPATLLS